jgi:hypothetical protein
MNLTFIFIVIGLALLYFPTTMAGLFVYGKYINENILKSTSDGASTYVIQSLFTIHCLLGFVIVINPVCQAIESRCRIPRGTLNNIKIE